MPRSKGFKLSIETKAKICKSQLGEKCHNWKGGISPFDLRIRGLYKYKQWRFDILSRDKEICQKCGGNDKIEVHHIKTIDQILFLNNVITTEEALNCKELWDITNGITLCHQCHSKIKYKYIRINI